MKLAIIGDFNPNSETHIATNRAITHSIKHIECDLETIWISTQDIAIDSLGQFDGYWIAPGSPYKNMEGVIDIIQYVRVNNIPTLGTCGGFQHMLVEYARNVLGLENVQDAQYNQGGTLGSDDPLIYELSCSLRGQEMALKLIPNSKTALLYGRLNVTEVYHCQFGVNPKYFDPLKNGPIEIVGLDEEEGNFRVLEYPNHKFFIGTLYVPQISSTEEKPHPIINGFINAIKNGVINKSSSNAANIAAQ